MKAVSDWFALRFAPPSGRRFFVRYPCALWASVFPVNIAQVFALNPGAVMRKTFRLSLATASRRHVCTAFLLSICLLAVLFVGSARADNGTWAQSTSGLFWSSPANWLNNTVADGATFTADFSTVNITAPTTVNLDSPRTIGQLKFQDATTADNDWTLSNNGVAGNVLTLANGTNQPIINVLNRTATISAVLAGTNGVLVTGGNATLVLNGADTYSGVTTVNSAAGGNNFSLILGNNNALGTSTVNFNPGGSNKARILLNAGVTINNNITLNTINAVAGGNGALQANGDVTATFGGTITVSAVNTSGGGFVGAQPAGGGNNVTNNYLIFSGPIIETLPSSPKNLAGGTTSNAIVLRAGNLRFADTTGTSSYYRLEERAGVLQVGANNGIATNAYIDIGGNSNGNPVNYAILDLNGFNQTLVGVSNFVSNGNNATITNTSTTTPATLTLAPANPTTNPNQANLVYTGTGNGSGGNVSITDASAERTAKHCGKRQCGGRSIFDNSCGFVSWFHHAHQRHPGHQRTGQRRRQQQHRHFVQRRQQFSFQRRNAAVREQCAE